MKRIFAMVLALAFVFALIPAVAPVDAQAATPSYIKIKTKPTNLVYGIGQTLDVTGMEVAVYDDEGGEVSSLPVSDPNFYTTYDVLVNGNLSTAAAPYKFTVAGSYTLTVRHKTMYAGSALATDTDTILVVAKKLTKVEITANPSRTEYLEGELFDPAGMVVTATYSDGSEGVIPLKNESAGVNGYTLTNPLTSHKLTAADKDIEISYTEKYVSSDGTVTKEVTRTAAKTAVFTVTALPGTELKILNAGDADTDPSVATITFKKSSVGYSPASATIRGYVNPATVATAWTAPDGAVAKFNASTGVITPTGVGSTSITLSAPSSGVTKTVTIVVIEDTSTYIEITTPPADRLYSTGDSFDPAGMVVKVFDTANPGGKELQLGAASYGYELEVCGAAYRYGMYTWRTHDIGEQLITVYYTAPNRNKYYDHVYVLVVEGIVANIKLETGPNKTVYDAGDKLDPTGLSYKLTYTNGNTEVIRFDDDNLKFTTPAGLDQELVDNGSGNSEANVIVEYTQSFGKYGADVVANTAAAPLVVKLNASLAAVTITDQAAAPAEVAEVRFYQTETGYFVLQSGSSSNLVRAADAVLAAVTDAALIEWGYPDTSVATFYTSDGINGRITATGIGETYLTLRARGSSVTKTVKIIVEKEPVFVRGISLDAYAKTLSIDEAYKPVATVQPSNADNSKVNWTLESLLKADGTPVAAADYSKYITINPATGQIKGLQPCEAYIVATADDTSRGTYLARCKITVRYIHIEELTLSEEELKLYESATVTLKATVSPADTTEPNVTWKSSDTSIATVDAAGKVTALKIGTAVITCTAGVKTTSLGTTGKVLTKTCKVTVASAKLVTKVTMNKSSLKLGVGEMEQLSAEIAPTDATTKALSWSSSNQAVATVNVYGLVSAVSAGSATIYAKASDGSNKYAVCTVTVVDFKSESIILSATTLAMLEGETSTLTATIYPDNATNKAVTWTSSNSTIAKVSSTGVVTGVGGGFAIIKATTSDGSGRYADCIVAVTAKIPVTSLSVSMSDFELLINDTTQLAATVMPTTASKKTVTWTSSNSGVVSVDASGKVGGVALGSAVITASADGKSASITITVTSALSKAGTVVNCKRRVNVRVSASGLSKSLGYAYLNEVYKVLGQSGSWYKVQYATGTIGYIWSNYINLTGSFYTSAGALGSGSNGGTTTGGGSGTGTTTPPASAKTVTIINCVSYVYIRSGPGTSYTKLGHADLGTQYDYVKTDGEWIQISYNGQTAYIHNAFCKLG